MLLQNAGKAGPAILAGLPQRAVVLPPQITVIKVIEITHLPRGKDGQFRQRVGQQGRPQFRRETAWRRPSAQGRGY